MFVVKPAQLLPYTFLYCFDNKLGARNIRCVVGKLTFPFFSLLKELVLEYEQVDNCDGDIGVGEVEDCTEEVVS